MTAQSSELPDPFCRSYPTFAHVVVLRKKERVCFWERFVLTLFPLSALLLMASPPFTPAVQRPHRNAGPERAIAGFSEAKCSLRGCFEVKQLTEQVKTGLVGALLLSKHTYTTVQLFGGLGVVLKMCGDQTQSVKYNRGKKYTI